MNPNRPWGTAGVDVTNHTNVALAMEEAGALFSVEVRPAYSKIVDTYHEAGGYNLITRGDSGEVLGMCKGRFVPLQNTVLVDIVQPLISSGKARLDTIGVLGNGEKVWMLVELQNHRYSIVKGDEVTTYLLLVNGHDGSTSVMVGVVPFRLWCSNMLPKVGKKMIKFKHTANAEEMLAFFKMKVMGVLDLTGEYASQLHMLTMFKPNGFDNLDAYFRNLFGMGKGELPTRTRNKLNRLHELFLKGQGCDINLVAGTWYAALNAVTEYLNYEAGRSNESRLNSLWFGPNCDISDTALSLALKECH